MEPQTWISGQWSGFQDVPDVSAIAERGGV
jgi:hypothetical protein